jgi:hypothetical protein
MAEHGLAQQGGRFNILYAEHRTEKTICRYLVVQLEGKGYLQIDELEWRGENA